MKINLHELLGVEEGEEFTRDDSNFHYKYRVYNNRIQYFDEVLEQWKHSSLTVNALVASEIIELPKKKQFTDDELCILRNIDKKYKWIARDENGSLCIFDEKPKKSEEMWDNVISTGYIEFHCYNQLFNSILWEDEGPIYIDDYVER